MGEVPDAQGPLAGITVVDLATDRAELAGRLLADLGAEVIKIEPPGGSAARRRPPFTSSEAGSDESLYWAAVGMGKRSVEVDLTTHEGKAMVRRLAASCDILIESFDPGVMAGFGLGYDELSESHPELIYVSVTPFGRDGPYADRVASELTIEAAGGLVGLQGDGDRPPVPVGYPQAAFHAGTQAAADSVIALNERAASGRGQHLDVSMQAAMVWTLMNATGFPPNTGDDPPNTGARRTDPPPELAPGVAFPSLWPCADGYVICGVALGGIGARTLRNLILRMERDGELEPEHANNGWTDWAKATGPIQVTPDTLAAARNEVANFFRREPKETLFEMAVEEELLLAPVHSIEELLSDPQLKARRYWQDVGGRLYPGSAVRMSRTPMRLGPPAPALGADQPILDREPRPAPPRGGGGRRMRPFEGLRVADFAWVGVGPLLSKALADHGATVVHIESTSRPDVLRLGPPFKDGVAGLDRSQFQANFNTSKVGLELNLARPAGQKLAMQLVDWADVMVESFTPGVLNSMGLGWEQVSARRPGLIMVSTCLYGQSGPFATLRGFGTHGSAIAGIHGLTGWPDRPPRGTWGAYTDFIAPRYGIAALAAAIFERKRSGLGQQIDLAQVEAAIHFVEPVVLNYTVNGRAPSGAAGHESDRACPHGVYPAAGRERYLALSIEDEAQWAALTGAIPPLQVFAHLNSCEERRLQRGAIDDAIRAWSQERDPFEAADFLTGRGVPASAVLRPSDLYNDPQLAHRGFFVTCDHAGMGPTPYDGPVTIFSATPPRLTAAPVIGQHNNEVLKDILGLSEDEIVDAALGEAFS